MSDQPTLKTNEPTPETLLAELPAKRAELLKDITAIERILDDAKSWRIHSPTFIRSSSDLVDERIAHAETKRRVEGLALHIRMVVAATHAIYFHAGPRETCRVGPCGPANDALVAQGQEP